MAEYIEREAVMLQINVADFVCDDNYEAGATLLFQDDVVDRISSIPAADVRPVVRGKWRFEIGDGKTCVDGWVCSACNCGFHTNVPYFEGFNFCPNCGADMREES